MKKSIAILVFIAVAVTAGMIIYQRHQRPWLVPAPAVEAASPPAMPAPAERVSAPNPEPPRLVSDKASEPAPAPVLSPVGAEVKPEKAPAPHSKAVDTLISAQTNFGDRQALLGKLKQRGELDAAITELRQRAADEPNDAGIPTALGEAIMNKFPVQDFNEASVLGLQIDQSFDAALKLDPANWEAQYEKANSMSYWPDVAGKGPEVIQRLSNLIDQQETMVSQPEFARTYVLLGDQYKKAGQMDRAQATWQLGAQKFPNNTTLQNRIAGP